MICEYCGKEMKLDHVDDNFKGTKDKYYKCENCNASAVEKIIYNKIISIKFYNDGGGNYDS